MPRPRRSGQSTVEWLGGAVAAAVLVLGVIAAMPGVASGVGGGLGRVVCAIGAAAGQGHACATADAEADETRAILEAPARDGRVEVAGDGVRAKTFGASNVVLEVTEDVARTQFALDDPVRCRSTGPGRGAPQLCSTGVLRECVVADPEVGSVRCGPSIPEQTLAEQASCARAPNAVGADPSSDELLCRLTTDDGSTAIFRCKRDATGSTADRRHCVDTGGDVDATVDPKDATCPAKATGPFAETRDGADGLRFDFVCLGPTDSAYLCDTFISSERGPDGFVPSTPTRPQRCGSRTIPNDPAHGDGRDLLGDCTGQELAPGAPRAQTLTCTLPDDETRVSCLLLDQTIQHCARVAAIPADTAPGLACPLATGRGLKAPTVLQVLCGALPPNPDDGPVRPSQVVSGASLDSPADDVHSRTDVVVVDPAVRDLAEDADDLLGGMRCAYGIGGLDDEGQGARVWLAPQGARLIGGGDSVGLTRRNGQVELRKGHENVLSHELGHALTVEGGLGIFAVDAFRSDPVGTALSEGFAEANSFLLDRYWQRGMPAPNSRVRQATAFQAFAERHGFGATGEIHHSPLDFLPGVPATSPHERGYVVVELLEELAPRIANDRAAGLAGCGGAADPLARWFGEGLRTLRGAGVNPGFTEWCEAMASNAPHWGVAPAEVRARFRRRGIPCGTPDPKEDARVRRPATCPLAGASADPSRAADATVRAGGACGV